MVALTFLLVLLTVRTSDDTPYNILAYLKYLSEWLIAKSSLHI